MNTLLCAITIVLLSSCSTTHNHRYYNDDLIIQDHRIVNHDYIDYGDYMQIIVKHRPHLTKQEKQRIKNWCRRHYGHHKKQLRFKFVIAG